MTKLGNSIPDLVDLSVRVPPKSEEQTENEVILLSKALSSDEPFTGIVTFSRSVVNLED
jgi:hypothetical protein